MSALEGTIERPEHLGQTFLSRLDVCPASAYLYKTVEHQQSIPMDRGIAYHAVLERCTRTMMENGENRMPGDVAREIADDEMRKRTDLVLPTASQDEVRMMIWHWAEATVLDLEAIIGVEVPLSMELDGWTLRGRLDRVEVRGEAATIIDAKTSLAMDSRESMQRNFQGQTYALMLLEGKPDEAPVGMGSGINAVSFVQEYPRYLDKETGLLASRIGSWTRTELSDFKVSLSRNIAAFATYMEEGTWPARSGSWCGTCPASAQCPIPHLDLEFSPIETLSDAEATFAHWYATDRHKARQQKALREWVKEHGPVYDGDLAFDATYTESKSVKDWDALELAIARSAERGEPFDRDAHIDKRTSTKFGKRKQTEEEIG